MSRLFFYRHSEGTAILESFSLQEGGKCVNPQELTEVSDWGEHTQPTPLQREG
ncbi:hypothetical protein FHW71_002133 [Enterobacter sp. Sphag1F]|jgi:hypothetical protein|nr:hypothetical protein [Enterobacter sp. Sphag1F]NYI14425.1 hypothetical protein [Enterobacter sp. Sphag71]